MVVCPPRNPAEYEIRRHRAVPAVRECLLERDERRVDHVGQEMEPEKHRW